MKIKTSLKIQGNLGKVFASYIHQEALIYKLEKSKHPNGIKKKLRI